MPAEAFFGLAFFEDEGVEDSAEEDDGEVGLVELDEEDAEGLSRGVGQRAELEDFAVGEFLGLVGFEAEFVGVVFEGEFVEFVVFGDGPVELVAEVFEGLVDVHGWGGFGLV